MPSAWIRSAALPLQGIYKARGHQLVIHACIMNQVVINEFYCKFLDSVCKNFRFKNVKCFDPIEKQLRRELQVEDSHEESDSLTNLTRHSPQTSRQSVLFPV